jgi:hypothetical protein
MTKRIADAVAQTLEHARFYLARLPIEQQDLDYDESTGWMINRAIPILFHAECAVRLENSQD